MQDSENKSGKIFQQIPKIMFDVEAIGKNRRNEQQKFQFRGIDDVYNELHQHLATHRVFTATEVIESHREEKPTKSGGMMTYTIAKIRFTFFAEDGSNFSCVVIGEGSDSGDKSSNKAMAVAHKYALTQVFAIPTDDEKDPDQHSHQLAAPNRGPAPAPKPTPAPTSGSNRAIGPEEMKNLGAVAAANGWTKEQLSEYGLKKYRVNGATELTLEQYREFLDTVQKRRPEMALFSMNQGGAGIDFNLAPGGGSA